MGEIGGEGRKQGRTKQGEILQFWRGGEGKGMWLSKFKGGGEKLSWGGPAKYNFGKRILS